jgi:hypothetical protein
MSASCLVIASWLMACRFDLPDSADALPGPVIGALAQQAYLKASNTGVGDVFGHSIALSADGSTLAVGAWGEDSTAAGIGGDQANNSAERAGAVYVFTRNGTTWSQQAYIKASNPGSNDCFGRSVALSADGASLAVGAYAESSAAVGINGNQADNSATYSGAVYVFTRNGTTWIQQAYIKASNTEANDYFGRRVALSADGLTLAVNALLEDSAATGINGDQTNNSAVYAGAVYVFTRNGMTWSQQAYIKASNTGVRDYFGYPVALSGNGTFLAVGAFQEDSAATGVNGNQADNSASDAGAVYVFARNGTTWTQQAYIKGANTGTGDHFGCSVALSSDGSILAVGADLEDSSATGLDGSQPDNSVENAGAVYLFTRSGTSWSQHAYLKASNAGVNDGFGFDIALSADGSVLAVGAKGEASAAAGVDGNQADNSASSAGAVYLFRRDDGTWSQQAYVKASNAGAGDSFGFAVVLSANGSTLAVGAEGEDSPATGIDGNQAGDFNLNAGAVYVFQ